MISAAIAANASEQGFQPTSLQLRLKALRIHGGSLKSEAQETIWRSNPGRSASYFRLSSLEKISLRLFLLASVGALSLL